MKHSVLVFLLLVGASIVYSQVQTPVYNKTNHRSSSSVEEWDGMVMTVNGLIPANSMGITLPHEHLLIVHKGDDRDLTEEATAISELKYFKMAGGATLTEMTNIGIGRNPEGLKRISNATGINVIMGSGYYRDDWIPDYIKNKSVEQLTSEIISDILDGIDGIHAGVIGEIGVSRPMTSFEEKVLIASARAQKATGAAIVVHFNINIGGEAPERLEALDILENAGADLSRVSVSHNTPYAYLVDDFVSYAQRGCYVAFDMLGMEVYGPVNYNWRNHPLEPVETVKALINRGYIEHILLSQDVCFTALYVENGGYGYAHILNNLVPLFRAGGITDEQIHTIMVENPKRLLPFVSYNSSSVDPLEPNNSSGQAFDLGIMESYNNSDLFLEAGDEDWLKFTHNDQEYFLLIEGYSTSTTGFYGLDFSLSGDFLTLETYETDGSTDTKMFLYNSSFEELEFNDDGGEGYFSRIVIELEGVGGCEDPLEPNNFSTQAFDLGSSENYSNPNLCLVANDEDWLKFTFDNQEYYIKIVGYRSTIEGAYGLDFSLSGNMVTFETFETEGSTDTKMYLYNSTLEELAFNDDGGEGYFSRIVTELEGSGGCEDPLEPNNASTQAFDLGSTENYNNPNLCLVASDEDWLKFTFDSQEYYIKIVGYRSTIEGAYGLDFSLSGNMVTLETFETESSTDTKMYFYNSTLEELAFNDDGGEGYFSRIVAELEEGGGCEDPLEPNNSSGLAYDLGASTNYNNPDLCLTPGDSDWLRFTYDGLEYFIKIEGYRSTTEGAYGLRLSHSGNNITIETYETEGSIDTKLSLFCPDLRQTGPVAYDDDGGGGYCSRIIFAFPVQECIDPFEPNNTAGQAFNTDNSSTFNNSNLCLTPGDQDWLKLSYNDNEYYIKIEGYRSTTEGAYGLRFDRVGPIITIETFATGESTDTKMYFFNSAYQELAFDDDGGAGYFSRIVYALEDDICMDPLEPNNMDSQAFDLGTFASYNNANLSLCPAGEEDWLKLFYDDSEYYIKIEGYRSTTEGAYGFQINREGNTLSMETFETDGPTDTRIYFYSSSLQELAFDDDGGTGYFSRIVYSLPSIEFEPNLSTALDDVDVGDSFSIFPNPTEGRFTIFLAADGGEKRLILEIMDPTGRIVIQNLIHSSGGEFREHIDLSNQAPGMYFIRLRALDFHEVGKVVVH